MRYFEHLKNRMPHFFDGVEVLEYTSHNRSKSIRHLFDSSYYFVVDPSRLNLDNFDDNRFDVAMSINDFQYTENFIDRFKEMHRVSSKMVMFLCSTVGQKPRSTGYHRNLTESDFDINLEIMFDTHRFHIDYDAHQLYFWGIKRNEV